MSGSVTVGAGSVPPITVPLGFSSTVGAMLQQYLAGVYASVTGGTAFFENNDSAGGSDLNNHVSAPGLMEITNTDSTGAVTNTSISSAFTVNPFAQTLVVQAPGSETVQGAVTTQLAILGSSSNVTYTVENATVGSSIYAGGGSNNITLGDDAAPNVLLNDTVYSTGNDTLNLLGQGSVVASITGSANDLVEMEDSQMTVTATGNSTVFFNWAAPTSGGKLYFVNNSTAAATVNSSVFNTANGTFVAPNSVTVFGGAGGGYYNAGQAGNNLLVGQAGLVTLVGAGNNDVLSVSGASSGSRQNALFAGSGSETLVATASTENNFFQGSYKYPGLGNPVGNDLISTAGAGQQSFALANGNDTIYGSTAATQNLYNIYGDSTTGGANLVIHNFLSSNSVILLNNDADTGPGNATISSISSDPIYGSGSTLIVLSDLTQIHLIGVSSTSVTQAKLGNGIIEIK
jgi:hypothetical protein